MAQTNVVFDGCPHAFDDECACVPCGALRRAARGALKEGLRIVFASALPPLPADGETAHPLLGRLPPFCRALADGAVVHYGGIWAQRRVEIESRRGAHRLKFTYRCRVRIITQTRARAEEDAVQDEDVPALDSPEQWVSDAQAADAVTRFWNSEEVYLKEGDVAWISEGAGSTIMSARAEAALWNYESLQFHVQIEGPTGDRVAWKTIHVKAWIQAVYVAQRLPTPLLTCGLWVVVCLIRTGEWIKVRVNAAPEICRFPSTISALMWPEA
jgi:hypothetical protein